MSHVPILHHPNDAPEVITTSTHPVYDMRLKYDRGDQRTKAETRANVKRTKIRDIALGARLRLMMLQNKGL
jgi:hypothetical protein